jgi:V/A-type H+-transporting ATPase subunit D
LIYDFAQIENSIYKLAMEIKKTQKRTNALEKIQMPRYEREIKYIQEVLEEKEREDFFRLKKVKKKKK